MHAIGLPRSVIRSYGTADQIDAELGLDEDGIRRQIARMLAPDGEPAII